MRSPSTGTRGSFWTEQLGLEPGKALQQLERAILTQDAALDAPVTGVAQAPEPPDGQRRRAHQRTGRAAARRGIWPAASPMSRPMELPTVEHVPVAESWRFNPAENPLVRTIGRIPVSVRTKLLAGFALIALLLVVVGVLGLVALGRSSSRVDRLGTLREHAATYQGLQTDVAQLTNLVHDRASATANAGAPLGRAAKPLPSNSFLVIDKTVRQTLTTFLGDAIVLEDADPALFRQVFAIYIRFRDNVDAVLQRDHAGTGATAGPLVRQELVLANALAPLMNGLASGTKAQADALVAQNRRSFTNSRNLFIGVAAASVILALALGFVLSWSLIVPLQRTEARLAKIAAGDFSGHVEVANRDEIGELAANVNRMNDELGRLYREAARDGKPPQVGLPGEHVARAADAAERDHRIL